MDIDYFKVALFRRQSRNFAARENREPEVALYQALLAVHVWSISEDNG
jgi:hypothetical protein